MIHNEQIQQKCYYSWSITRKKSVQLSWAWVRSWLIDPSVGNYRSNQISALQSALGSRKAGGQQGKETDHLQPSFEATISDSTLFRQSSIHIKQLELSSFHSPPLSSFSPIYVSEETKNQVHKGKEQPVRYLIFLQRHITVILPPPHFKCSCGVLCPTFDCTSYLKNL